MTNSLSTPSDTQIVAGTHATLSGRITAPAKVNFNLRITGKRDDGYHLLNSVVIFTEFGDAISIEPHSEDLFEATGPFIDLLPTKSAGNLCMQAITRYREQCPEVPPLRVQLDKQIPIGAGLGGGSADAAAILRHLNAHVSAPLSEDALAALAATLGADVTVCLRTTPQFMDGIGEQVTPIALANPPFILLANPNIPLLTGPVFQRFSQQLSQRFSEPSPQRTSAYSTPITPASLASTAPEIVGLGNDLTGAAIALEPKIGMLINDITACDGALVAAMSGSGASCFGLFPSADTCKTAAEQLRGKGHWAVATRIL